jgi:hypothetical protein
MKAVLNDAGLMVLTMTMDEAVVIHERIASSEWSDDLLRIELPDVVHRAVFSDVQQQVRHLLPTLGTDRYGATVREAEERLSSGVGEIVLDSGETHDDPAGTS